MEQRRDDMARFYTASLSQTQDRSGYSIIFRHPVRKDKATGKTGVRVRRGLDTRDLQEAERLRDQLNELLQNSRFHNPSARAEAERQFDPLVVKIFFGQMVPEEFDFEALRDGVINLPDSEQDGYRRVLFLGTTGAGKTTLVRQLIGTDPVTERFPSISPAKTTIHDTEIVFDDGPWRAVVTFVGSDEVKEYVYECISAAGLAVAKGADDTFALERLLSHVNQRFRFKYILGNGPVADRGSDYDPDEEDEETENDPFLFGETDFGKFDLTETNDVLAKAVSRLREITNRLAKGLRNDLGVRGKQDERVFEELFEEELDYLLRDEDVVHEIADSLMDEIEKRFDLLPKENVSRNKQGWPLFWKGEWPVEQRKEFLRAITRFSSNYAPLFGQLLTPIVNGVRVAGPFSPSWNDGPNPKLVLLDGEGLGHTPKSSSAVSTAVSRRIEAADAVLLVDNAAQPMQAAPLAAMRELVSTGNARKLILAFTHFDDVKGDNLPNTAAKKRHVLASAENVLASFGEELGPYAERALRTRIDEARFFLAGLQDPLSDRTLQGKQTIKQLVTLLQALDDVTERPEMSAACPVYDRMNLVLAIKSAAESFHEGWMPRLGRANKPGITKEHWTRVRALSRRLATGMADEYDSLKPVADLRKELVEQIYVFVQNPVRWEGPEPSDDQRQVAYDSFADNLARRFLSLATRRVWRERTTEWQTAFDKRGSGSTFERAQIIDEEIYEPAAPVPDVTPSPDRNQFLHDVVAEVQAAATEVGAKLD